jgi:7-cyano-7-deazaguanine synthase in queuosine biosynthesis
MAKDLAIVLNNGGLNSLVATALAAQRYRPIMLFVDRGATPGARRKEAFDQQSAHFKPYRSHTLAMPFLSAFPSKINSMALASDPRQESALLGPRLLELLPLIAVVAPFAAHYSAAALYLGLRTGPAAEELGQATEYIQILNELIQLPCNLPEFEIVTPLLELEDWQVVDVGVQVGAPLEKGWSCQQEAPEPCGACRGCRTRDQAFVQAAKPDPLKPAGGAKARNQKTGSA